MKVKLTDERRSALSLPERADIAVVEALGPVLRSRLGRTVGQLGNLADEAPLLALSAVVGGLGVALGRPGLTRAAGRMISAALLASALKEMGKDRVDRTRPEALLARRRYRMGRGSSRKAALRSFPSGHTAGAVALARAASRELPGSGFGYAAAATAGVLQVLRGAHFPGDVLAGALVGVAAETVTSAIFDAAERSAGGARDSTGSPR